MKAKNEMIGGILQLRAKTGARGGDRTHNLQLRRLTLYPIELHAQGKPQNTVARAFAQMEFAADLWLKFRAKSAKETKAEFPS